MADRDLIQEKNEEAIYNIKNQNYVANEAKFFGDYDFVPVQESKADEIREEFKYLNEMVRPTLRNASLQQNHQELQDRLFNRMSFFTQDVNKCIRASRNVKESNYCCDVYLSKLRNEARKDFITILKDY